MKLFNPPPVVESMTELGFSQSQTVVVGAIALACVLLYLVPRTAVLGAILLTGYLGGAIAAQVRINAPVFSLVFPLMIAALFWGGLYLRDGRVAAIIARPD